MVPFWRSISRCFLFSSWHEKGILYGCLSSFPPQFPRYLGIWYLIFFFGRWTAILHGIWDGKTFSRVLVKSKIYM